MRDAAGRILGAIVGSVVGLLAYWIALRNGYHLLVAVGASLGIGCGWMGRRRSLAWGTGTAVLAVAFSIVIEWHFLPFSADDSFRYFMGHLGDLPVKSKISLIAVGIIGFYFGMGRNRKAKRGRIGVS